MTTGSVNYSKHYKSSSPKSANRTIFTLILHRTLPTNNYLSLSLQVFVLEFLESEFRSWDHVLHVVHCEFAIIHVIRAWMCAGLTSWPSDQLIESFLLLWQVQDLSIALSVVQVHLLLCRFWSHFVELTFHSQRISLFCRLLSFLKTACVIQTLLNKSVTQMKILIASPLDDVSYRKVRISKVS